jgi:hypothetical protein
MLPPPSKNPRSNGARVSDNVPSSDREKSPEENDKSFQAEPIVVDAKPDDELIENADESVERAGW